MAVLCFGRVNTAARDRGFGHQTGYMRSGDQNRNGPGRRPDYGYRVAPLTHTEAQRRAALIQVSSYDVQLELTRGDELFGSTTTVRFTAVPGTATFVDVAPHELHAVHLNGRALDPGELETGRLPLTDLAAENELVVEATMAYSHDGEGLHRHVDPADGRTYLYAMSFLDAAPRWFACFDQPDLKALFTLDVTAPPEWTVLGNAPAQALGPGRWRLATAHPVATYFTTIVAGPYHSVVTEHDGIRLGLHTRASLARELDEQGPELLAVTGRLFDEFHRLFGVRYPWGEYHQAFVPDFNAGAMENPGCVTFRDTYVFRSRVTDSERGVLVTTIAHEMAHQWFGNLVTMRWWDDLWLNESFAEYLGYRVGDAVSDYRPWVEYSAQRKHWGYAADRRPSTHPVAGNGVADTKSALTDFDGISYAKGAAVLRQLAVRLGDDTLLAGLRQHFHTHAYGNATFADLIGAWASAGAQDLDAWADVWLRTSGMDTLNVTANGAAPTLHRRGSADRPHAVSVATFDDRGRELGRHSVVALEPVPVPVPTPNPATLVLPDANDDTWAKTAFDAETWQRMPALLPAIEDPMARVTVWNALRLAVADAELSPDLALRIIEAGLPDEVEVVLGSTLAWAVDQLAACYLPDGAPRAAATHRLAAVAERALQGAEPGSSRQLTAARAHVRTASDVAVLRSWLDGRDVPPGLVLDDELRWLVVGRLAGLGGADASALDAELGRDRSAQGRVHAARCRAALPTAEAKAAAWQAITGDAQLSNYELYALAEGFWQPGQSEVTAPYVDRYFAEIAHTAGLRSGWVVARVAGLAYPRTAVSPGTLEQSDALLARSDLDSGIRRSVVDAADDLRRALASRQKFA
jgi:aminopeptidase N